MKRIIFLFIALIVLMTIIAQEKYSATNEPIDSNCKDLVNQLNVLLIFGQPFAKSHNMTAEEYGQYVGEQYVKQGWVKGGSFEGLSHACLYNLSCFMPESEIEIVSRTPDRIKIKSGSITGFYKKIEPFLVITGKDYQDFFTAALSTIAKEGGCNYKVETEGDMAYTTISKN